jgi:ribose transport system substrate-binding protein
MYLLRAVALLIVFITLFCGAASATDANKPVIAFAQDTLQNDFRKAQLFEVRDAVAEHPDLRFTYSDAQGQTSLLIRQIDTFIDQKVAVLIVGTNDESAVVPVVSKAQRAGVPVIILDRGIVGKDFTTFINSDNIKIGALGGAYIAEHLKGKGLVLLFEGLQKADVTQLRSKGFLDEMAKHQGIRVIRRTGNYLRKDAVTEMEKLVAQGIHVDAIFSESDSMLSGVRLVLAKHKIDPRTIIMVGCDYTSEARDAILQGTQTGSVLFPLGGKKSIDIAREILAGKPVPKHFSIPVQLITKDNAGQVPPIF